ncbi:MAG: AAA family ATPase [Elusimicrobiota bacterium]|jgi:cell division protease FtsH|nr:AAA family ATPase [Elusimicrobiota bacterium]
MRKLKRFVSNNLVWIIIGTVGLFLIVLSIYGLSQLESFYRTTTLATMPIQFLMVALNALIFVFFYAYFFMRRGFGQLKKTKIKSEDINVKFSDVIGLEGAKKEALEVVSLIKDRKQVQRIGGKIIKGLLLMGPPGCGKTLLAKAIACECGIPFINMSGSEFVEVFVGVGASRVRNLFKKAREYASVEGACIVFIDEIEVIGRGRTFSYMGGGEETNSTQNQLLVEMDGLDGAKSNIIVIAATNASESILDKALTRPGRFDRKINITFPNLKEREALFSFYLQKVKYSQNVSVDRLSRKAVGKSPADIENIVKEAALISARKQKFCVDLTDLSDGMDRIDLGMETYLEMTPAELEQTAYHEAGHALTLYMLHPTNDVFKITIKSHKDSLGLVSFHPKEELHSYNKEKLLADILVDLSGYAAEKIKYGTTTTGVASDFTDAMRIANAMVWRFGMGKRNFVGDFSVISTEQISPQLKKELNDETMQIMQSSLKKVDAFLRKNWKYVDAAAKKLLEVKELDFDEFEETLEKAGLKTEKKKI